MNSPQHFLFILAGGFSHLAFSNAIEPLRIANRMSGETLYCWSLVSENGQTATSSSGITLLVDYGLDDLPDADAVFVVSGNDVLQNISRPPLAALRKARTRGIPLGTLCSGAFIFGKAGFLDGKQAALH